MKLPAFHLPAALEHFLVIFVVGFLGQVILLPPVDLFSTAGRDTLIVAVVAAIWFGFRLAVKTGLPPTP